VFIYFIVILALERHKGCNVPSCSSPAVDDERMRPDCWLWLVLCVPFNTFALMVGWQEGHPFCKKDPVPLIIRGSLPEEVKKEPVGTG